MDFYSGLAGSDFRSNLLVEQSRNNESHDLSFSRGQGLVALLHIENLGLLFSRRTVTLESLLNCVQQILIPKGLRQEFHGTRFQCLNRHGHVSVRRYKNNRNWHATLGQTILEIEPTHLRQPHIQNKATWAGCTLSA